MKELIAVEKMKLSKELEELKKRIKRNKEKIEELTKIKDEIENKLEHYY